LTVAAHAAPTDTRQWPNCRLRSLLPLAAVLLLASCAQTPRRQPAAATQPVPAPQPSGNGELVPRAEPRSASGNPPFYEVGGHRYIVLASAAGYRERGVASWYGPDFHGLKTATGERYDMFAMTAAHKTLPIPCYARVTNLSNGRSVVVRINDRGPFVSNRIIDLSYSAARGLDMIRNGTAFVEVETLMPAGTGAGAELPVTTPAAATAGAGPSSVPPITEPLPQSVNTPEPGPAAAAPPAATAATAPAAAGRFYIQVGAFSQADNARRAAQKLRAAGLEHVITLAPSPGQPLERVRIGPISSVQEFDQLIAKLSALGFPAARLAQD
jgi:rare lipoprotein A